MNRRVIGTILAGQLIVIASILAGAVAQVVARALGARVTLRLAHPDAPILAGAAMEEVRRLERIFSLYLPDSDLVRLNSEGALDGPPFELLECLTVAGAVHVASGGRFDPTVQTLWRAEATARERGAPLTEEERRAALARTGWGRVRLSPDRISLEPGSTLTLVISRRDGERVEVPVTCRLDTAEGRCITFVRQPIPLLRGHQFRSRTREVDSIAADEARRTRR